MGFSQTKSPRSFNHTPSTGGIAVAPPPHSAEHFQGLQDPLTLIADLLPALVLVRHINRERLSGELCLCAEAGRDVQLHVVRLLRLGHSGITLDTSLELMGPEVKKRP